MFAQAVQLACLLQLIVYVSSQFDNPLCTEYYQLLRNDSTNAMFGRLEVPSTVKNNAVNVSVILSVPMLLNTSYVGTLKLHEPKSTALDTIYNSKPLKYNIHFATQDPLPRITGVMLNNKQLCTSPKLVGPIVTSIELHHSLTLSHPLPSPISRPISERGPSSTTTTSPLSIESEYTKPPWKPVTKCGIRGERGLIPLMINGTQATDGDWPWVVAIFTEWKSVHQTKKYLCAGTLLSEIHVLTAAHCVQGKPELYTVALGRIDIKEWRKPGSMNKEVQRIEVHPRYINHADSDLAIIVLNSKVKFNSNIVPICLWTGDTSMQDYVGESGVVVGWGKSETSDEGTDTAFMVKVRVAQQGECLITYKDEPNVVTDRTFCAASADMMAGPCSGDSGTGFVMNDKSTGIYYLRGIVSTALAKNGKCDVSQHVLYVNVAHYTSWIKEQLAKV